MEKKLTVAIIGAGHIAGGYDQTKYDGDNGVYSHAGAYKIHSGFILETICDKDSVKAKEFQQYWHVNKAVDKLENLLSKYHDVISICTPDATHFDLVVALLQAKCCKTIVVEKPIAVNLLQVEKIIQMAEKYDINVIVNFQRRNDKVLAQLAERLSRESGKVLSGSVVYMKGLEHIGITVIDTITYLLGYPEKVMAYNRVFNRESKEYSYEFIMFYDKFTISVRTIDSDTFVYNYHIFEVDVLLADSRISLVDNSRLLKDYKLTDYAYSGVKVLDEHSCMYHETEYKHSMLSMIDYVSKVTRGQEQHRINTPQMSYNNKLIIDAVIESYDKGLIKIALEESIWKR